MLPKKQAASVSADLMDWDAETCRFLAEQKRIETYVLHHPLTRPKTNALHMICIFVFYLLIGFLCAFALTRYVRTPLSLHGCYLLSYAFWACLFARFICVKAVECYQHYAKESTRRKCLCMPTCSEYALLALKHDWFPVALCKILKRLFRTCRGGDYKYDPFR